MATVVASDEQLAQLSGAQLAERYRLGPTCGRGALCVVYAADDTLLRRPVAVKVCPLEDAGAYREALEASGSLSYPAFLAVYDVIEQDGYYFVVQEYIDGRPLTHYLADGAPARRGVALLLQVARAVAYAHQHNFAHGDLVPPAILIDRQAMAHINNVRLPTDWEYFSDAVAAAALSDVVPDPEATLEALRADERTRDVWAIGAALWLLLTRPLGEAQAPYHVAPRAYHEDVTPETQELLARILDLTHMRRLVTAEALALALEECDAAFTRAASDPALPAPYPVTAYRDAVASGQGQRQRGPGFGASAPGYEDERYQHLAATAVTDTLDIDRSQTRPANRSPRRPPAQRARAAQWDGYAERDAAAWDARSGLAPRDGQVMRVWTWILIGVALFVAFYLLGYFAVPQLTLF
ncbi:MAG TPA: protein kinase [Ktedonobacterales bacterium]